MTGEHWYLAVEDQLSEAVALRVLEESGRAIASMTPIQGGGFGKLKKKLPEFIRLAPNCPVLLLTDLDDHPCPSGLISAWSNQKPLPPALLFRVVVREIEAWILADRNGFAAFSGVPLSRIPETPETLPDPKQELLELVKQHGQKDFRKALLPDKGVQARVGLGYNTTLTQFVRAGWNLKRAAANAPSLERAWSRVRTLSLGRASTSGG